MRFTVRIRLCAAVAAAALLFAGSSIAQTVNATLGGTVMDTSGAVIPHVAVTATDIDTGVATKATSNDTGSYEFPSLQAGNYKVSAVISGFKEFDYDKVTLDVAAQVRLNFTLPVASGTEKVEVTAVGDSPLLATSPVVGGLVTGQQILDLPLIDQSATNLALTQSGLNGGIGAGVSVVGGQTQALSVTLNGISVSNTRLNRAGGLDSFQLNQTVDLVEEVKTVTSPVDAELGHSLGSVQMIVRSGTNKFSGSLVDGLRNTDLNANTFWNNTTGAAKPILIRNQFAGRVGGPIRKNKTFFFFLYDGNRQRTTVAENSTVLTAQARQGNYRFFPGVINSNAAATSNPTVDFSGNPLLPIGSMQTISVFGKDPNRMVADPTGLIQKYIGMTPLPNNYLVGDGLNTAGFLWQVPEFANRNQETVKIDHYFNPSNHVNVVYTFEKDTQTGTPPVFPTAPVTALDVVPSYFASVNYDKIIKPTLLNEFKIGLQHPNIQQFSGVDAYPQLYPSQNGTLFTPGFSSFTSPIPGSIEAGLVDPVYTIGDSVSWVHGRHSFKAGFQFDAMGSNSFNINNNVTPAVSLGAGSTAVQGINDIPGLVTQNQGLATNMLTDLTGSVASVVEGFGVANGKNPVWIPYPSKRAWHQRQAYSYLKDDFKVTSNLTLNLGVSWAWAGVPWDSWGRTPYPTNGFGGLFGISGTTFDNAMWNPGAANGSLTQMVTVGPNSANPNRQLYNDYYKAFAPSIGLSWAIPYWGANKTVLRAGWAWSRPLAQSFLTIDGAVPNFGTSATVQSVAPTFLNSLSLPLSPTFTNPLQTWPINDKTQSISAYDPNFMPPVVQNFNVSLERQITKSLSIAVRYVGNMSTHLAGGYNLNFPNVEENGIAAATNITAQGGNAALFNQLLMGINVPGSGVVNGTTLTGSQALRAYSSTYGFLAANGAGNIANFFNTTQSLQPTATAVRGGLITNAGLPANFVVVNPQYSGVTFTCACANADYNSGVFELNQRLSTGLAFQTNFTWAKVMQLNGQSDGSGSYRNPRNWNLDQTEAGQKYSWKASGTYNFPLGVGRKFLNGTTGVSGVFSNLLGNWQTGAILTVNSGSYLNFSCTGDPLGGSNNCSSVGPLPSNPGHVIKGGNGVTYFSNSLFGQVTDPYCATLTTLQNLQSRCTDKALTYNGNVLIENSAQGQLGTMADATSWLGPGLFDLDMNMLKRFKIKERYTMEFRMDAISVTNTAHFTNPNMSINSTSFGLISAPSSGGGNANTTPSTFYGNRVYVANLRLSF